jgi:transcription initiation factor TFIIB
MNNLLINNLNIEIPNDEQIFNIYNNLVYENTNNVKCNVSPYKCYQCDVNEIFEDYTNGIIVCNNCGVVISNIIDSSTEMINYNDDTNKISTHGYITINVLFPHSSTSTIIKGKCSNKIKTSHKWDFMPYEERRLCDIFKIIQQKCSEANIIKCIEDDIKILFNNVIKVDDNNTNKNLTFRGKNLTGMISACMYHACKKNQKSRTPKEISELFNLNISKVTKGIKNLNNILKTKNLDNTSHLITPEQFIIRFCNILKLKEQYIEQTLCIVKNISKIQIALEHNPVSIATGAIFLMIHNNNLNISRKKIAELFHVSLVTISKTFKKFLPFKNILLNDTICNQLETEINIYKKDIKIHDNIKHNFIRFGVNLKEKKLFNFVFVKDDKIKIKKKLFNKLFDEQEKFIKKNNYIFNKVNYSCKKFINQLNNYVVPVSEEKYFIQTDNEIKITENINKNNVSGKKFL